MNFTNKKLVISGQFLELYDYELSVPYGYSRSEGGAKGGKAVRELSEGHELEEDLSPVWRAKRMVRRIIEANARRWKRTDGKSMLPIFITLTFAENKNDEAEANGEFTLGMERFNHAWRQIVPEGLKYIAVPERQKKTRDALHYHLIVFNLPYIPMLKEQLLNVWGKGFTNYQKVTSRKIARYLTKYMSKTIGADRDLTGKRYFTSRGLLRPRELMDAALVAAIESKIPGTHLEWASKPIPHKRFGDIRYRSYLLPEDFDIAGLVESISRFKENPESDTLGDAHEQEDKPVRPKPFDN